MNKYVVFFTLIAFLSVITTSENPEIITKVLDNFMEGSPKDLFKVWHFLFEKKYALDTQEAKERFAIFKANLREIREKNAKNLPYKLGLNQYSDMSKQEFKAKMLTKKVVKGAELERLLKELDMKPAFLEDDDDDLTKRNLARTAIDYRRFFPVARNQGNCGSCWAFSTAGVVEGNIGKKKGTPINYLSTQQLVDCDTSNSGCDGGLFGGSFTYVKSNGLEFESAYPYKAAVGSCKYSSSLATNRVTGFKYCSNYGGSYACDVNTVYNLLVYGPLSVGIDGSEIQSYTSGIFNDYCYEDNHAVVLAGYGVDATFGEYWLVRNSWGSTWGEKGYIRVAIDENNYHSCYVNNEAYLPIV